MVKISDAIRKLVILKKSEGASYRMIAKDLNIGHSTVQYIYNKFLRTKTTTDLPKSGRPSKCTVREKRHMCRNSKKNPFLTAHEVAASCNMLNKVSVDTVRRYLRNSGLFGRMASRKPLLSPQHMKNRKSCVPHI